MELVVAKRDDTAAHIVAVSIMVLNMRKIRCAFLDCWSGCLVFYTLSKRIYI